MQAELTMKQAVLETERLLLKELTPEILAALYDALSDEEAMEYFGLTAEGLATEKAKLYGGGFTTYRTAMKQFLLVEKSTGRTIGRGGFHNWYAMHSRAELGYAMNADEELRGKGYMKEAVTAMIAYGFEHMGLNRIEAYVGPTNEPSLRIVCGMGFTQEGVLREHYCCNGVIDDSVCFGLLKREWEVG
ncbi:MAG: GNAT family protein [Bacteroidota bacterium]